MKTYENQGCLQTLGLIGIEVVQRRVAGTLLTQSLQCGQGKPCVSQGSGTMMSDVE